MSWQFFQILGLANLLVCSAIGAMCLARLATRYCQHNRVARAGNVAMVVGALGSGWQPIFFGEWPAWGQVVLSTGVLVHLTAGALQCRRSGGRSWL